MKETTLIFDYDGTIHDTLKIYSKAFKEAYHWLAEQNLVEEKEISSTQISSWLGWNARDMWNAFQPDLAQVYKDQASAMIGNFMLQQITSHKAVWYPETQYVLNKLKEQYNMVVLSNCKTAYKEANWQEFNMGRWFDNFYDCESYAFAPKTEIVKDIMLTYPGKYIVIGDRRNDMDCAKVCHAKFIGCLYGFGQPNELDNSDSCIDNITELLNLLLKSPE